MNVLFISYWGIEEGLSQATIIPHVTILSRIHFVDKIILATIERGEYNSPAFPPSVTHVPLRSKNFGHVILTKLADFVTFTKQLKSICKQKEVNVIIARSSLAGALAYLVWRDLKIPYIVESYEPHTDYMIEAGVWGKWDIRTFLQRYFEAKQNKTASWLLPVANGYAKFLEKHHVPENKMSVMPCCVEVADFEFSTTDREQIRKKFNIPLTALVGIYAGKFGGIYYEEEAFDIFEQVIEFFGSSMHLIILTDYRQDQLIDKLTARKIDRQNVHIDFVSRDQVKHFLSAADFALSFYRKSPSMRFLSPIKIGEYWANGLPVLIEEGIGDDAAIARAEGGGVVFDKADMRGAFSALRELLLTDRISLAKRISKIAKKHRDLSLVEETYQRILKRFTQDE